MQTGGTAKILGLATALAVALVPGPAPPPLHAGQAAEPAQWEDRNCPAESAPLGSWKDFVTLEVGEEELILTNVSDRAIVAWTVRTVVRFGECNEGWSGSGTDGFRAFPFRDRQEGLLLPGESVSVEKGGAPSIPEHLEGSELRTYHDVGALVFENADWIGVPEVVDRIFESRLDQARAASKAMEVATSADAADASVLDDLPRWYRTNVESYATLSEALRAIHAEASEDYLAAVANLRPEDLTELQLEKDPPPSAMQMEPLPLIPPPSKSTSKGPSPEDFARLEIRETEFVLTNISDRTINAWVIKIVRRSSQGRESRGAVLTDAYRSANQPIGQERLLHPGESVSIEKGEQPPLGGDYRGPGAGVYYAIGALTFEGGEAVGDPQLVDDIFESRLEWARSALKALELVEVAASAAPKPVVLDELPARFGRYLDLYANRAEALRAIHNEALEEYGIAVANLRPQDVENLPQLEEE